MAESNKFVTPISTSGTRDVDENIKWTESQSTAYEVITRAHGICEFVTPFEGGMLSSCEPSAKEDIRAHKKWLQDLRSKHMSEEEFETARTQVTWAEVTSKSPSCTGLSTDELERLQCENQLHFQHLVQSQMHPHWPKPRLEKTYDNEFKKYMEGSFVFVDLKERLEVGQRIGGGRQAEIYESVFDGQVQDGYVLKVFRSDSSLADLQSQWLIGIAHFYVLFKDLYEHLNLCCHIKNGTLLKDGRFGFVMKRYWGDLRKAIDLRIINDTTHLNPPFPLFVSMHIMECIAIGMRSLHEKGILHRDLKAANLLVHRNFEELFKPRTQTVNLVPLCVVADYESCKGVLGTGFWRAPEILLALKDKAEDRFSDPKIWTPKVDVYAYAMTCYEVLTGCIPFQFCAQSDYDGVIGGERPPLPDFIDPELQDLLRRCWHHEPLMRPTFYDITNDLRIFIIKRREFYMGLAEHERDDEATMWIKFGFIQDRWRPGDQRLKALMKAP